MAPTVSTFAVDIDSNGNVLGSAMDANNFNIAFVRNPSGTILPGVFGYGYTTYQKYGGAFAMGMNSSSIVGSYNPGPMLSGLAFRCIPSPTGIPAYACGPVAVPGSVFSSAECINEQGDIAGSFTDSSKVPHGFLLTFGGTFAPFDVPGTTYLEGARITASDEIIGYFADANSAWHGLIRSADGTITQIDAPGATNQPGYGTFPNDINANGTIVGGVYTISSSHSFFRASDGTFTVFDPPNVGTKGSSASGINTVGVIVGTFTDSNSVNHGYIRNLDLSFTTLDDPNATAGTSASRINDSGQVVGTYADAQGSHGFVRK